MADHLDEPPQKKVKKDPFQGSDTSSELIIFLFYFIIFPVGKITEDHLILSLAHRISTTLKIFFLFYIIYLFIFLHRNLISFSPFFALLAQHTIVSAHKLFFFHYHRLAVKHQEEK